MGGAEGKDHGRSSQNRKFGVETSKCAMAEEGRPPERREAICETNRRLFRGRPEGIVKDAIEDAFLEAEPELGTGHLHRSMEKNKSHAMMMKGKTEEYRKRFKEMGIGSASDQG